MSFFLGPGEQLHDEFPSHTDSNLTHDRGEFVTAENSALAVPKSSSSVIKFYPAWCCGCFGKGGTKENPLPQHATLNEHFQYWFQCPPFGPVAKISTFLIVFVLFWTMLYFLIGDVASFKGPIFSLVILEISGLFLGILVKCMGLPTLLAPLTIGILLRNVEALDLFEFFHYPYTDEYCRKILNLNFSSPDATGAKCCNEFKLLASSRWIGPLRQIALTFILTRAGLELSPKKLLRLKLLVPLLAFGPCLVEASAVAGLFYAFFHKLEPNYAMLLVAGFALSAVSPAVVVPGVMSLSSKGYGIAKGIPTLLVAASSIDDVLAITLFTIFLKLGVQGQHGTESGSCKHAFVPPGEEHNYALWITIAGPFIGILIGLLHGLIAGMLLHFLPSADSPNKGMMRTIVLLFINLVSVFGYGRTGVFETAGSIGVLFTSFVAGFGWRSQPHWKPAFHKVENALKHVWTLYVPILFGTIGKEIKFTPESPDPYAIPESLYKGNDKFYYDNFWNPFSSENIAKVVGIIIMALLIRMSVVLIISRYVAKFRTKESIFMGLAWIPKATVQAALAPLVITEVLKINHTVQMTCIAKLIVTMSVMGIMITAPIGAISIALTGPRFLAKATIEEKKAIEEAEFPNGDLPDPTSTPPSSHYSSDVFYSSYDTQNHKRHKGSLGSSHSLTFPPDPSGTVGSLTMVFPITTRSSQSLTQLPTKTPVAVATGGKKSDDAPKPVPPKANPPKKTTPK